MPELITVDINEFIHVVHDWHKGDKQSRLRQTLMNKLLPSVVNPNIFYEESHNKAHNNFASTYVPNYFEEIGLKS